MKVIKTNKLIEAINNVGEFETNIRPEVPASFANEVKVARDQEKKAEKVFADKEKEVKDLDNSEYKRLNGHKIKRSLGSYKLHLEESLLSEEFSIKVGVRNYRPSNIKAIETYKIVREAGKLNGLQELLARMFDDEETDVEEIDKLLTDNRDWILNMLDIDIEDIDIDID